MILLDNLLKPDPGPLVIQCTGRTSFSVDQILPAFIIRAKLNTFHRKDSLSVDEGSAARALSGTSYEHIPGWGVAIASVPRQLRTTHFEEGDCYSRREGGHDWSATGQYLTSSGSRSGSNYG